MVAWEGGEEDAQAEGEEGGDLVAVAGGEVGEAVEDEDGAAGGGWGGEEVVGGAGAGGGVEGVGVGEGGEGEGGEGGGHVWGDDGLRRCVVGLGWDALCCVAGLPGEVNLLCFGMVWYGGDWCDEWEDFIYIAADVSGSNVRYTWSGEGRSTVEPRLPAEKVQGTNQGCSTTNRSIEEKLSRNSTTVNLILKEKL